jgi:predicted transcriptional regulator with HTH domain
METNSKKELDPGKVIHSLSRSNTRREISLKLCERYPGGMTSKELSREIGCDEMNVIGALTGYDGRYSIEDSLVAIGLAAMKTEKQHGEDITVFTAAFSGEDMITMLKNYATKNKMSENAKEYLKRLEAIIAKKNNGHA